MGMQRKKQSKPGTIRKLDGKAAALELEEPLAEGSSVLGGQVQAGETLRSLAHHRC